MKNILDSDFKLNGGGCPGEVQVHAFMLGYTFDDGSRTLKSGNPLLFFNAADKTMQAQDFLGFMKDPRREITLTQLFALEPKPEPKEEVTFKTFDPVIVREGSNTK